MTKASRELTVPEADGAVHGGASPSHDRCYDVLIALRRIMRAVDLHSHSLVQRCGLTGPQLLVLREIGRGEVPAGALAKAVSLSQATITGILDRLESRGFVERRRGDNDKRQVLVRATGAGKRMLSHAPRLLQDSFVVQFTSLAEWEQTQLIAWLQRVVAMMEATALEVSPMLAAGPINSGAAESADERGADTADAPIEEE
jgi:DNA-binding MarR family transcriptional regulator